MELASFAMQRNQGKQGSKALVAQIRTKPRPEANETEGMEGTKKGARSRTPLGPSRYSRQLSEAAFRGRARPCGVGNPEVGNFHNNPLAPSMQHHLEKSTLTNLYNNFTFGSNNLPYEGHRFFGGRADGLRFCSVLICCPRRVR